MYVRRACKRVMGMYLFVFRPSRIKELRRLMYHSGRRPPSVSFGYKIAEGTLFQLASDCAEIFWVVLYFS